MRWIKNGAPLPCILRSVGTLMHQGSAMERIKVTQHTSLGAFWLAGWLFTIGYLHLDFWMGLLGLFVWPYFIGSHLAPALT